MADLTVSTWVNFYSTPTSQVFPVRGGAGSGYPYGMAYNPGGTMGDVVQNACIGYDLSPGSGVLTNGSWYQLTMVYVGNNGDGSSQVWQYLNGHLTATNTYMKGTTFASIPAYATGKNMYLGGDRGGGFPELHRSRLHRRPRRLE